MNLRDAFRDKVALTGGAATGKSTVLGYFQDLGWKVASADQVAGELFGDEGFQRRLASEVGMEFPIDRAAMRERTFADDQFRRLVNSFYHRPVLEQLAESGAEMIEVPLLCEVGISLWFLEVVTVSCDAADQEGRLMSRLGDEGLVRQILSSQLPQIVKVVLGGQEIRTSCSFEAVLTQAERLSATLRS